jgi:hypothetical protein
VKRREKLFLWFDASTLRLFEVSYRCATGRRDLPAVDHQAMRDALTVGDELPANRLGVLHAGILVLLLVRHRRHGRDCDSKQTECQ